MNLPKQIRFWLFKLKARNYKQKIKEVSLISVFWVSIISALIIWIVFSKTNNKPTPSALPESPISIVVKDASPSIQVFLFKDETLLKDLPNEINTEADLESLITASQNTDLNIDNDLNQINY